MKKDRLPSVLPPVLDTCCGSRMFWFNKTDERAIFLDKRRERCTLKDRSSKDGFRELLIDPDIAGDFTELPFTDETFRLVVFDPPHYHRRNGINGWTARKYGTLGDNWRTVLTRGFAECFRVLKPYGVLILKWSTKEIPVSQILKLTPESPLFGHKTTRTTIWVAFIKGKEGGD